MRLTLILSFLVNYTLSTAQKIDNTASFRQPESERYFRINYDNDYFAAMDKNYTQGYSFEYVAPALIYNPLNKLFFHFNENQNRAGIAFEHIGFTPSSYEKVEVQIGDRPFSATALLKSFVISMSKKTKQRISSHLSFGVMGPSAKGKEIQSGIHKLTGDRNPLGWRNQIENHFIANYGIDYEKQLFYFRNFIEVNANASAKIGNLYTNASIGLNASLGLNHNSYTISSSRKFFLYGYIQPLINFVGYDGTLQGGLVNDESVYTVDSGELNRVVGQMNYGIVLQSKSLYLEYTRTFISKEIKTVSSASWGGVRIGFKL